MRLLITGANSFIGRHAVVGLARAGLRVTATFRSESVIIDQLRKLAPDADFRQLDLAAAEGFLALPKSMDAILHIAGISTEPAVTIDEMLACNVIGSRNLIKYAATAGVFRVVFASTLSVHGDIDEDVVTEATPVRNPDIYGASKYLAERLFAAESHWLSCAALRLPGVLGAGAHRAWVPTLLERIKHGENVVIYHHQAPFNNAAHVDDLNGFYLRLLNGQWSGFHAFPVGASGRISIAELVKTLIALTGSRSTVALGDASKRSFTVSSHYAAKNFGYDPMHIDTMLRHYVSEYLSGKSYGL